MKLHRTSAITIALTIASALSVPALRADFTPNDPDFQADQWYLQAMNMPQAWSYSLGSPSVKIGILDTGLVVNTPQLQGHFETPTNVFGTTEPSTPADYHGTWVASTIGMAINDGIAGAGTGNFTLAPIRVTNFVNGQSVATDASIEQGITAAVQDGCRVINISLSASNYGAINTFVGNLLATTTPGVNDFMVFMAAGNSNSYRALGSPDLDNAQERLSSDHLIMVGGTEEGDARWVDPTTSFTGSDAGPFLDISAPAHNILVDNGDSTSLPYGYISGTSFSTPFAASAAALAFSINPTLTATEVQNMLFNTAFNPDNTSPSIPYWDSNFGWGRVDIGAVAAAANATLAAPEPSGGILFLAVLLGILRSPQRRF